MPDRPAPPRPRTFRLLEVLVSMCILVTLAGLLVPYTVRVGERTRLENAAEDLATIASRLSALPHDLRAQSDDEADAAAPAEIAWLRGPGQLPAGCPAELVAAEPLDRLALPRSFDPTERSPLLIALRPDPWGSAYLIRFDAQADGTGRSAALSAGPDGVLNTGDDLQVPID